MPARCSDTRRLTPGSGSGASGRSWFLFMVLSRVAQTGSVVSARPRAEGRSSRFSTSQGLGDRQSRARRASWTCCLTPEVSRRTSVESCTAREMRRSGMARCQHVPEAARRAISRCWRPPVAARRASRGSWCVPKLERSASRRIWLRHTVQRSSSGDDRRPPKGVRRASGRSGRSPRAL